MGKTILYDAIDGCILLAHNDCVPDDQEFSDYCIYLNQVFTRVEATVPIGVLVYTDGVGPTAKQRALLHKKVRGRALGAHVAILTHSVQVRGIITAFNWLGRPMAAFKPPEINLAFDFIKAPIQERREAAQERLLKLRAEIVGLSARKAISKEDLLGKRLAKLRKDEN